MHQVRDGKVCYIRCQTLAWLDVDIKSETYSSVQLLVEYCRKVGYVTASAYVQPSRYKWEVMSRVCAALCTRSISCPKIVKSQH